MEKRIIEESYELPENFHEVREHILNGLICPKCGDYSHYSSTRFVRKGWLGKKVEITTLKCDCGCKYEVENLYGD